MNTTTSGQPIRWMGTKDACERLGVTLRTLYRFIDEGQLPAYKMGRVIRVQEADIDAFIERMRIVPGTLDHLYPEPRPARVEGPARAGGTAPGGAGGLGVPEQDEVAEEEV